MIILTTFLVAPAFMYLFLGGERDLERDDDDEDEEQEEQDDLELELERRYRLS